jgi:hypothetical protein
MVGLIPCAWSIIAIFPVVVIDRCIIRCDSNCDHTLHLVAVASVTDTIVVGIRITVRRSLRVIIIAQIANVINILESCKELVAVAGNIIF